MKLRRSHPDDYLKSLRETAILEMEMGIGDWQDTLEQVNRLNDTIQDANKEQRDMVSLLSGRIRHLENVIHRREEEYDHLQNDYIELKESLNAHPDPQ